MSSVDLAALSTLRADAFRTQPGTRLASVDEAVDFIDRCGFVFFWPAKGFDCPSLWVAAAGDRPVPDEHDDPGHVTWGWKDSLLGKRRVFYGRVIRKRNAFISLSLLPSFYALSPNYGDFTEDYMVDYEQGQLTNEARQIYEAILHQGPLDTITLRKAARLTSKGSDALFNRALDELQSSFRILPIGVAEAGAWRYAFIYEIVARHYPELTEQAHPITETQACQGLALTYLRMVGAARAAEVGRMFKWQPPLLARTLDRLEEAGQIVTKVTRPDQPGDLVCLPELAR